MKRSGAANHETQYSGSSSLQALMMDTFALVDHAIVSVSGASPIRASGALPRTAWSTP